MNRSSSLWKRYSEHTRSKSKNSAAIPEFEISDF